MSRRIPFRLVAVLIVALPTLASTGCSRPDEALRDAWALWLENEPTCAEPLDPASAASLAPRWRLALAALTDETLEVMEERLAETDTGRGEARRLLGELVAVSRRSCELTRGGPAAAPASTVTGARSQLAATRSRLAVVLPLDDAEIRRRAGRYDLRLSNAVSDALERIGSRPAPDDETDTAAAVPRLLELPGRVEGGSARELDPGTAVEPAPRRAAGGAAPPAARETISIRPVSGEPWSEIRRRRAERATSRLASWRRLYDSGLRPVAELRAELAGELRHESLEGASSLCVRLGEAAERVPRAVVEEAPSPRLAADLAALLEAYAGAGRACAADRPTRAWQRLTTGDRRWREARRVAGELAARPGLPESLRREPVRGNLRDPADVD